MIGRHLHISKVGPVFLSLGLIVGGLAGLGLMTGFEPAKLPPELLNIAAYKLTFAAAGGLLTAGALLVRYSRRKREREASVSLGSTAPRQLGNDPGPTFEPIRARDRAPINVPRSGD